MSISYDVTMTSCSMKPTRQPWKVLLWNVLFLLFACQQASSQADSQWLQKPQDQLVRLGGTARFVCKSRDLNPNIVWSQGRLVLFVNGAKFNQAIPDRYTLEDNFTLKISQVEQQDNGMYGCNVQDLGSASANLTVLLPPGPPSITSDITGDVFEEGQRVRFTCSSSGGNPPPSITWTKNGLQLMNGLQQISVGQTTTNGGTTRNTISVVLDHSDHQANYTCFVSNQVNNNSSLTTSVVLNVRYSPIITFEPFSPYIVRLDRPANITCQVDANPSVNTVAWTKDGQNIPGTSFVRMFSPVRRADAGNYTCVAYNALNSDNPTRSTIKVDVVYPPVVSVPAVKNIPESRSLTVRCSVDANPPPFQIIWELVLPNGQRRQKSNSEVLSFPQIRRGDAGNYSCKASSLLKVPGLGSTETVFGQGFTTINVQYAPGAAVIEDIGNIDVGQTLQLTCSASPQGFPEAQFKWHRNGAEQSQKNATYIIRSTALSDTAVYTCTPYNIAGQGAPANISVSINEPPKILEQLPEEITRTISNTQPLTLTCRGQGRPQPIIEWIKDDMTESLQELPQFYHIRSSSKPRNTYSTEVISTLTFKGSEREPAPSGERIKLRMDDLGNYTCRVRSTLHTVAPSSTVQLFVQFAPVVSRPSQKIAVTITDRAYLPCQAQSYPQPVFQWFRDGALIDMDSDNFSQQKEMVGGVASAYRSTLMIHSVGSRDYGLYHCFVSNFLANVSTTLNVTTKSTPEAPTSLQTLGRTWDSIHLQWRPGFNGGYTQTFKIVVLEFGSQASGLTPSQPLSVSDFNVTGLKPSTRYQFSVYGVNELGIGQHSGSIISQTFELDIPTLSDNVPVYHTSTRQLVISAQPSPEYCLKIDSKDSSGSWKTLKQCTRVLGAGTLELVQDQITGINVSVCLVARPEICGVPTRAEINQPDNTPVLTVRDVIIIACVCAAIIITLLVILICFICRRRATAKAYENSPMPPPASNGGVPGKKMQAGQSQSQPQSYDNADGRADGYRGQQESIGMHGRPMSPKDKYIDLEDPNNDPSLQSQESGYSTGDPNKPKKVQFTSRFGWRPPRPFSARRRILSRMRKKQKSQPHLRFSHSPPGHTCGLPCCSEDTNIHARLNAPSSRYRCIPVPTRSADLENNFTFRRNQLISGRPTFTNKFYSLQTRGIKGRAGLPKFQDDFGIIQEDEGGEESASAAHEDLRQYRATFETDTDGSLQPYLDRGALDSHGVIRTPTRYLQPWECFHNREITLPDLPSTPRKMVFLDYRPDESHDGEEERGEEEERIEVYTSGYRPPSVSSTPRRVVSVITHPPQSSSTSTLTTTHSSSSSSTQTTSTSTASSSSSSRPKVSYSGAVRPIPTPVISTPLKSALKKPKSEVKVEESINVGESENTKCLICQSESMDKSQDMNKASVQSKKCEHLPEISLTSSEENKSETNPEQSSQLQQQDSEDLYESHVYDVLSDVAPRLTQNGDSSTVSNSKQKYNRISEKPPPVPPTRRNDKPQPEKGRKAITPELKRRFSSKTNQTLKEKSEERYSTFPTRKRHHHYEELILSDLDKAPSPFAENSTLDISHLDLFAESDKAKLLDNEHHDTEESLYEALNSSFLSDSWSLTRDKDGGSLNSVESAHLSHHSYASFGLTCLSSNMQDLALSDVTGENDVTSADDVQEKRPGFLADNPITLIL